MRLLKKEISVEDLGDEDLNNMEFDDTQEKEMITRQLANIFKTSVGDSQTKLKEWKMYGLKPHEFCYSRFNPNPGKLIIRDKRSKTGYRDIANCCSADNRDELEDNDKLQKAIEKQNEERRKQEEETERWSKMNRYQLFRERLAEGRDF